MSVEIVKNLKFGDKIVKTDANGNLGAISTGNITAGDITAGDITAINITTNGGIIKADTIQFYYNGSLYQLRVGDYGAVYADAVS